MLDDAQGFSRQSVPVQLCKLARLLPAHSAARSQRQTSIGMPAKLEALVIIYLLLEFLH